MTSDCGRMVRAFAEILPGCVAVSGGSIDDAPDPLAVLSDGERASVRGAGRQRLREFAAGRHHARQALAAIGFAPVALPTGTNRSPCWPEGAVGSLTHGGDRWIVAAVAHRRELAVLGIDLVRQDEIEVSIWPGFLGDDELDRLTGLPVGSRSRVATASWCAKEATIKALGGGIDPRSIEVCLEPGGDGFSASVGIGAPAPRALLRGRLCRMDDFTVAAAFARAAGALTDGGRKKAGGDRQCHRRPSCG